MRDSQGGGEARELSFRACSLTHFWSKSSPFPDYENFFTLLIYSLNLSESCSDSNNLVRKVGLPLYNRLVSAPPFSACKGLTFRE